TTDFSFRCNLGSSTLFLASLLYLKVDLSLSLVPQTYQTRWITTVDKFWIYILVERLPNYFSYHEVYSVLPAFKDVWIQSDEKSTRSAKGLHDAAFSKQILSFKGGDLAGVCY
uniref:Uncharacterized protein n=1 Tax=Calidris pygmaea TaxID=425635 RepID=A0A8C3KH68_9CHAR